MHHLINKKKLSQGYVKRTSKAFVETDELEAENIPSLQQIKTHHLTNNKKFFFLICFYF